MEDKVKEETACVHRNNQETCEICDGLLQTYIDMIEMDFDYPREEDLWPPPDMLYPFY